MPSSPRFTYRVRQTTGSTWEVALSDVPVSSSIVNDDARWSDDYRTNRVYWHPFSNLTWQELRRVAKYQCGIVVPRQGGRSVALSAVRSHLDEWLADHASDTDRYRANSAEGVQAAFISGYRNAFPSPSVSPAVAPSVPSASGVSTSDLSALLQVITDAARSAALEVVGQNTVPSGGGVSVDVQERLDELSGRVDSAVAELRQARVVQVRSPFSGGTVTVQNTHKDFDVALRRVGDGIHLWLYGPAGTGKSTLAKQVFQALGLECESVSATPDMMRHHFLGVVNPLNGEFRETPFYRAYKYGRGCLVDEADNMSASFFAALNDGLASESMMFDNGETVVRHPDFRCIASGNTVGRGATALYRRQQLDEATLDRFTYLHLDLDPAIEDAGVAARLSDAGKAESLLQVVRAARANVDQYGLRVVVTPRASFDGARMLELGEPMYAVIRDRLLRGCNKETGDKLLSGTAYDYDGVMGVSNGSE